VGQFRIQAMIELLRSGERDAAAQRPVEVSTARRGMLANRRAR
jgi:hypothetical protein